MTTSHPAHARETISHPLFAQTLQLRLTAAKWMLPLIIGLPLSATAFLNSFQVNALSGLLLLFFFGLLAPEGVIQLLSWGRSRTFRIAMIVLASALLSWTLTGEAWRNGQALLYGSALLFCAAMTAWFKASSTDAGLAWVIGIKLLCTVFASLVILHSALGLPDDGNSLGELLNAPPIYRHIRHLNIDLMISIALGVWAWKVTTRPFIQTVLLTVFCLFGFLSVWSAGRGAMLSLALFWLLLLTARRLRFSDSAFYAPVAALVGGGLLAFVTGYGEFFLGRLDKLLQADNITSSRIDIWAAALKHTFTDFAAALLGHGPNAFFRLKSPPDFYFYAKLIQPHNAFVQWIMEFGVLGTCVLGLWWMRACSPLSSFREKCALTGKDVVRATMFGLFFFSLVDGILFHAVPLIMVVVMFGYLNAKEAT